MLSESENVGRLSLTLQDEIDFGKPPAPFMASETSCTRDFSSEIHDVLLWRAVKMFILLCFPKFEPPQEPSFCMDLVELLKPTTHNQTCGRYKSVMFCSTQKHEESRSSFRNFPQKQQLIYSSMVGCRNLGFKQAIDSLFGKLIHGFPMKYNLQPSLGLLKMVGKLMDPKWWFSGFHLHTK